MSDMSDLWKSYDDELEAWPMPDHLQDFKVKVRTKSIVYCMAGKVCVCMYICVCSNYMR